ncbi:MAG TPA: hypothetical protein VL944_01615 [Candidatus Acidoferrum sp.]|nr:hypothetical protein [Candidatus Acidoferrum sp.]
MTLSSSQNSITANCAWYGGYLNATITDSQPFDQLEYNMSNSTTGLTYGGGWQADICTTSTAGFYTEGNSIPANIPVGYYQVSLQRWQPGNGVSCGQQDSMTLTTQPLTP